MSAVPAAQPNGQKRDPPPPGARPLTQNPNRLLKPRAKNNALVQRRTGPSRPTSFRPPPKKEGFKKPDNSEQRWEELKAKRAANGGWSETPAVPYKEYPLYTTKRALREGIRYHVMRFNRTKEEAPVDPTNQDQFPRPVSLHRRDARVSQARGMVKDEDREENAMDEAEAEKQRVWKEQQDALKAANAAQVAPVMKKDEPTVKKTDKRSKALSTYYPKHTEEAKKASALRYEETLPWHLEDVDGKNVWVGSYVAALSEVNVALVISGGGFRMIPLERYYKFKHRPAHKLLSLDEAEKIMGKAATDVDRWVLQDQKRLEAKQELADTRKFLGGGAKVKMESDTSRAIPKAERMDDNDINMSGDEFQDDDENVGFDADDEDTKDTKERVRRDHLGASIFAEVKEEEVEKEEKEARLEKMRDKQQGKKLRKKLVKYDQNLGYESDDSSDNPFQSSSDSDSEDEKDKDKDKAAEEKKEEEKKAAEQKDKLAAGDSTKGNTTPSSKGKAPEANKKVKSLKRPASPNASESSGNESSRKLKKLKKNNLSAGAASANASRSGTPLPRRPGGATSDGEATAGEGSDGGLKPKVGAPKKIKLKTPGTSTPSGSRAGSPLPQSGVATHDYAKPGTPTGGPPAAPVAKAPANTKPITGEEIVELIISNSGAISIQDLLARFKGRVGDKPGQMLKSNWVKLVKSHATYGADKLLRPKGAKAAAAPVIKSEGA